MGICTFASVFLASVLAGIVAPAWTNHNNIAGSQPMMTNFGDWATGVQAVAEHALPDDETALRGSVAFSNAVSAVAVSAAYTKAETDAKLAEKIGGGDVPAFERDPTVPAWAKTDNPPVTPSSTNPGYAKNADYARSAGTASKATKADEADYAAVADEANWASTAAEADFASEAQNAQSAGTAYQANTAAKATLALTANHAADADKAHSLHDETTDDNDISITPTFTVSDRYWIVKDTGHPDGFRLQPTDLSDYYTKAQADANAAEIANRAISTNSLTTNLTARLAEKRGMADLSFEHLSPNEDMTKVVFTVSSSLFMLSGNYSYSASVGAWIVDTGSSVRIVRLPSGEFWLTDDMEEVQSDHFSDVPFSGDLIHPSLGAVKFTVRRKTNATLALTEQIPDVSGYQPKINDLGAIRAGAALGATAYQKPSGGIPASDIASGVIPDVSGFVPYTGATHDVDLSGYNISCGTVDALLVKSSYGYEVNEDPEYGDRGATYLFDRIVVNGRWYCFPWIYHFEEIDHEYAFALRSHIDSATTGLAKAFSSGLPYLRGDATVLDAVKAHNGLLANIRGETLPDGFSVDGWAVGFETLRDAVECVAVNIPGDAVIRAKADFTVDGTENWASLGTRRLTIAGLAPGRGVVMTHVGRPENGIFSGASRLSGVLTNLTVASAPDTKIANVELVDVTWEGSLVGASPFGSDYRRIRMTDVDVDALGGKYAVDVVQGSSDGDAFTRCTFRNFARSAVGFVYHSGNVVFEDCVFDGSSVDRPDTVGLVNFQGGDGPSQGNPVFRRCEFRGLKRTVAGKTVNGPAVADRVPDGKTAGTMTFDRCTFADTVAYVIAFGDAYGGASSTHIHFNVTGDGNYWTDWDAETGRGTKMRPFGSRFTGFGYLGDAPSVGSVDERPWEGDGATGLYGSIGRRTSLSVQALAAPMSAPAKASVPGHPGVPVLPRYAPLSSVRLTQPLLLNADELVAGRLADDYAAMTNSAAFRAAVRTVASSLILDAVKGLDGTVTAAGLLNALKHIGE